MGATMEKTQRTMMMVLPLVFVFVVSQFPTGLVLYWVTTNLWTVGQGLITRRLMPKPGSALAALQARSGARALRRRRLPPAERRERQDRAASAAEAGPAAARAASRRRAARAVSREVSVEATGETVGEAKWKALRDLERMAPGLDKANVRFQVVSEGERGLLGVGYAPARVIAAADAPDAAASRRRPTSSCRSAAARVRALVEQVVRAIGTGSRVDVRETDEEIAVACVGGDAGLLIGKHGQTIDALQYVANAAVHRRGVGASR